MTSLGAGGGDDVFCWTIFTGKLGGPVANFEALSDAEYQKWPAFKSKSTDRSAGSGSGLGTMTGAVRDMQLQQAPAPGARALIRDEEWIVQNADVCQLGGWQLSCIGISETVRNRRALFLSQLGLR